MRRFLMRISLGFIFASLVLNAVLVLLFSWTYTALTQETLIATVSFSKPYESSGFHIAHLNGEDGKVVGDFKIYGEQWRIDAKFMKMKYWSNLLKLDSRYVLERFEGRYKKSEDQNTQQKLSHDLGENTLLDRFTLFGWNPFVDIEYGSSVYQEITLNQRFEIYKTPTGFVVRRASLPADVNTLQK
ncbi:hypothetical protein [Sulfurospirillum barnesii]|uniref:Uncharacterized protein n=1 Tax=Sulfurospirillum barnesii (strain ATCC 700032 / DSM 10660 / SES-3) TaxID=760154 RepID=I3XX02_SULBS|nr:hypothetical protein [Sulfurospirillum barnesii]AFL68476.1 hypothetical protein Sulba_1181 [Sulfurospirillum barnesii SES-3]